ncbi:MAG: tetratricopeptide repeat protein [Sedimentisphaerales bacterium]|nr:tetratricopeptide repeat protein [Sedimentisphaerales bacterium]
MTDNQDNQIPATTAVDFPEELKNRAREFFRKGGEVAYTLNYDYAIELYLDGLNFWPDALDEGHKQLREIALRRQAAGGKKSGFTDSSKYRKGLGKSPKDLMLKAEYLLSKDPSNPGHMMDMVKAAVAGEYKTTAEWMANMLFAHNRQQEQNKQAFHVWVFLKENYEKLELYAQSLSACQFALQIKKDDRLEDSLRDLSARTTMQEYDNNDDFTSKIKDKNAQSQLLDDDKIVKSQDTKQQRLIQAKAEYEADPTVPGKITKYVNTLVETETEESENQAVEVLNQAFEETRQFQHLQRAGEIQIKQAARKVREAQKLYKAEPGNAELKQQLNIVMQQSLQTELKHYELCIKNYPTDMRLKYEYGKRLMRARKFDEAIPVLQEARTDPRHRISSLNNIGQCFFYKQWYTDSIEMFQQALENLEDTEGNLAKELRYNLGRAYEADGKIEEALDCFRKVAQLDFNYLDVKERVEALRKQQG